MSDTKSTQLDIPTLDSTNHAPWAFALDTYGFLFGWAFKEWKAGKEISSDLPDLDDTVTTKAGNEEYVFEHNLSTGKASSEGKRDWRYAVSKKEERNTEIHADRKHYITVFNQYMSQDSKSKMRSMDDYEEANIAVSSFRLRKCIEQSHSQVSCTPIIVDRLQSYVTLTQESYTSLSTFMIDHSQGTKAFRTDFESKDPAFKNHVNIDTLSSALLLCASGSQFSNLKDNKLYDRDIHSLEYQKLTSEMVLYASSREQKTSSRNSAAAKILELQRQVPGNLAMTVHTDPKTNISICIQCQKEFPTTFRPGTNNEIYNRCKACAYSNRIEKEKRDLESKNTALALTPAAALTQAQDTIQKAGGTVNMTATQMPSYRDMLAYAMIKDQFDEAT
jgi:hypothetical protein